MEGNIFASLLLSLGLTLVLELTFALMWGVERRDLPLVGLVNLLTNPVVVLCHALAAAYLPQLLTGATLALELGAASVEGWLYHSCGHVKFPWGFSLCANLFSFTVGLLL